jgi:hypothetical protein
VSVHVTGRNVFGKYTILFFIYRVSSSIVNLCDEQAQWVPTEPVATAGLSVGLRRLVGLACSVRSGVCRFGLLKDGGSLQ